MPKSTGNGRVSSSWWCIKHDEWVTWSIRKQWLCAFLPLAALSLGVMLVCSLGSVAILGASAYDMGQGAVIETVEQNVQSSTAEFASLVHAKLKHGRDAVSLLGGMTGSLLTEKKEYPYGQETFKTVGNSTFDIPIDSIPGIQPLSRLQGKLGSLDVSTYYLPWVTDPDSFITDYPQLKAEVESSSLLDHYFDNVFHFNKDAAAVYVGFESSGMYRYYPGTNISIHRTYDPRARPWYRLATDALDRGDVVFTEPYVDAFGLGWMITIAKAVYSPSSQSLIGVVGLDFRIDTIQNILAAGRILENGFVAMAFRGSNRVLSHPDWAASAQASGDAPKLQELEPRIGELEPGLIGGQADKKVSVQRSYNRVGYGEQWMVAATGQGTLLSKEMPFVVFIMVPEKDALSALDTLNDDVRNLQTKILIITLIVCVVVFILTLILLLVLIRRITEPIDSMLVVSEAILDGASRESPAELIGSFHRVDLEKAISHNSGEAAEEREIAQLKMRERVAHNIQVLNNKKADSSNDEISDLVTAFVRLLQGIRDFSRGQKDVAASAVANPFKGLSPLLHPQNNGAVSVDSGAQATWSQSLDASIETERRRKIDAEAAKRLVPYATVVKLEEDEQEAKRLGLKAQLRLFVLLPLLLGIFVGAVASVALLLAFSPSWMEGTTKNLYNNTIQSLESLGATKASFMNEVLLHTQGDVDLLSSVAAQTLGTGSGNRLNVQVTPNMFYGLGLVRASGSPGYRYGITTSRSTCNNSANPILPCQNKPFDPMQSSNWYTSTLTQADGVVGGSSTQFDGSCPSSRLENLKCQARLSAASDSTLAALVGSNEHYLTAYMGLEQNGIIRSLPWTSSNSIHTASYTDACTGERFTSYDPRRRGWYCKGIVQQVEVPDYGSVYASKPYIDAFTGKVILTLSKPMADGAMGVAAIDVLAETLSDSVLDTEIMRNGFAFLLNRDDTVAISKKGKTPPQGLDFAKLAAASGHVKFVDPNGVVWFAAGSRISVGGFTVGIVVPESDILAASEQVQDSIRTATIVTCVVYVVILLILAFVALRVIKRLASRVIEPFRSLRIVLDRLGSDLGKNGAVGEIKLDLEPTSREVGLLQQCFDKVSTAMRVGTFEFSRGDFSQAETFFKDAAETFKNMGNSRGVAVCTTNLAMIGHKRWETEMLRVNERPSEHFRNTRKERDQRFFSALALYEESISMSRNACDQATTGGGTPEDQERLASRIHNAVLFLCDQIRLDPTLKEDTAQLARDYLAEMDRLDESSVNLYLRTVRSLAHAELYELQGEIAAANAYCDQLLSANKPQQDYGQDYGQDHGHELQRGHGPPVTNKEMQEQEYAESSHGPESFLGIQKAPTELPLAAPLQHADDPDSFLGIPKAPTAPPLAAPLQLADDSIEFDLAMTAVRLRRAEIFLRAGNADFALRMAQEILAQAALIQKPLELRALNILSKVLADSPNPDPDVTNLLCKAIVAAGGTTSRAQTNKAIAILLDRSGSMAGSRMEEATRGAKSVIESIVNPGDLTTFFVFNHQLTKVWKLRTFDPEELPLYMRKIDGNCRASSTTRFYDSVYDVADHLKDASFDAKWLIALTDGADTHSSKMEFVGSNGKPLGHEDRAIKYGRHVSSFMLAQNISFALIAVGLDPTILRLLKTGMIEPFEADPNNTAMIVEASKLEEIKDAFQTVSKAIAGRQLTLESY